jgi:hypothetical protein
LGPAQSLRTARKDGQEIKIIFLKASEILPNNENNWATTAKRKVSIQ